MDTSPIDIVGARRQRKLRFRIKMAAAITLCSALGYFVVFSSWFAVEQIKVEGNQYVTAEQVLQTAQIDLGRSMVFVNTSSVDRNLRNLPEIKSVEVRRVLPHTVILALTERTPIGKVWLQESWRFVDDAGIVFGKPTNPATDLIEISADQPRLLSMSAKVLAAAPTWLRGQVQQVRAETADAVSLLLNSNRTVLVGSNEKLDLKFKVLQRLMKVAAQKYDVSSPDFPVVQK